MSDRASRVESSARPSVPRLATGLQAHNLDIGWAVETVLRSATFFRDDNIRSKVQGPVDLIVGAIRVWRSRLRAVNPEVLASWMAAMGQDLFYPPNVGGWAGGRAWLSAREAIARINFAHTLAAGELAVPCAAPEVQTLAERHGRSEPIILPLGATARDPSASRLASLEFPEGPRSGPGGSTNPGKSPGSPGIPTGLKPTLEGELTCTDDTSSPPGSAAPPSCRWRQACPLSWPRSLAGPSPTATAASWSFWNWLAATTASIPSSRSRMTPTLGLDPRFACAVIRS